MATQFQNYKKKLTRDFIKNNRTPNWDEYSKIKDHHKSFVEYKKSETFAQKSAQAKNSASKKRENKTLSPKHIKSTKKHRSTTEKTVQP
jgi:hypothetical protein